MRKHVKTSLAVVLAAALALSGCSGSGGGTGILPAEVHQGETAVLKVPRRELRQQMTVRGLRIWSLTSRFIRK